MNLLILFGIALGLAMDAFSVAIGVSVGLSFAALRVEVWIPASVIGPAACAMTPVGTLGGRALGRGFGTRVAVIGGIVLIAIEIRIVLEHVVLS